MSALAPIYSAYHTWREEVPIDHGPRDYSVVHSAAITFIARDGTFAGFGNWDDDEPAMIHDLKEIQ
jgi:cytochrome oxidase Cu insertion factor (SCO1/SenC/PrrC family)